MTDAPAPVTFRVHFEDGQTLDVIAATPDEARRIAAKRIKGVIGKVKIVREPRDG